MFLGLMMIGAGTGGVADPVTSHDASFSKAGLIKADVSTLKDTQLVAQPEVPLAADQNVLWCGTLQLAWNDAIQLVGEKLHFEHQPPVVDLLNQMDFQAGDLDPGSYVAIADFERNHVENEIRAALLKTFHGAASPELIPPTPLKPGPDDFVAYAYLYKNLAFANPFADNSHLIFGGKPVENFGFNYFSRAEVKSAVSDQVQICDYQSADDFVIKLQTQSPQDELILAKITPASTLQATVQSVLNRIAKSGPPQSPGPEDQLAVPKLNFDLRRDFTKLEGLTLVPGPEAKIKSKLTISKAEQLVRFQLNEKGAILESEATVVMLSLAMRPMNRHTMIFDRPFLILMKQANAPQPYFALWVGNASLLIPAKKS
jgi:hypothetical protein